MPTGVRAAETMYTGGSGGILKCVRDQTNVVDEWWRGVFQVDNFWHWARARYAGSSSAKT